MLKYYFYNIKEHSVRDTQNQRTIEVYNRNVDAYIKQTPEFYTPKQAALLQWIDYILTLIPPRAKILELGSATCRDANYMRNKGYHVTCSDASSGFVNRLRSQGEPALLLNVLKDDIPSGFDMIFANAVVQHLTFDDLTNALKRIYSSLQSGGILAFNAKEGEGESWINEKFEEKRYARFWKVKELMLVVARAGYEIISVEHGIQGDLPNHIWIRVHARKP